MVSYHRVMAALRAYTQPPGMADLSDQIDVDHAEQEAAVSKLGTCVREDFGETAFVKLQSDGRSWEKWGSGTTPLGRPLVLWRCGFARAARSHSWSSTLSMAQKYGRSIAMGQALERLGQTSEGNKWEEIFVFRAHLSEADVEAAHLVATLELIHEVGTVTEYVFQFPERLPIPEVHGRIGMFGNFIRSRSGDEQSSE